jgi:integrase
MGLTKRTDGWYVEFRVLDDGKTLSLASGVPGARLKRWKTGTTNRTLAKQQEALIKTELMKGIVKSATFQAPKTFVQWAKEYIEIEEVKILDSYRERCQRIEKVLKPLFGQKLLQDISVKDVEEFRKVRGADRSQSTVNLDHSILKHMLKHAMKRDYLTRNVATLVASPKPKNARDRVLTPEEWDRLYKVAPEWYRPVLTMGYHTGMRLEEILGLLWEWVNLDKKRIYLPGSITKNGQDREVPMFPDVFKLLRALKHQGGVTRMKGLVFLKDGHRITHSYRTMQAVCEDAKIENFVFHDLRHCAVTNLADAGVDIETIMKIVGHSTVDMFLRYRKVKPEKLDAAMDTLNTYLTRQRLGIRKSLGFQPDRKIGAEGGI